MLDYQAILLIMKVDSCIDHFTWRNTCGYMHMSIQILFLCMHDLHPCSWLCFVHSLLALLQLVHNSNRSILWFCCYYRRTPQTVSTRLLWNASVLSDKLCKWNQLWRWCFLHFVHSVPVSSVFRLWFSCNKVTKLCNPLVFYTWLSFYFINWGSWIVLAVLIC